MSQTTQTFADQSLRGHSCVICRQRKVKCDRRDPCTNCVKAEKECSFIAPVRGKRRLKKKLPREGLHAKLKRYEQLLQSYGARTEPSDHGPINHGQDGDGDDDDDVDDDCSESHSTVVSHKRLEDAEYDGDVHMGNVHSALQNLPKGRSKTGARLAEDGRAVPKFIAKNGESRYFDRSVETLMLPWLQPVAAWV